MGTAGDGRAPPAIHFGACSIGSVLSKSLLAGWDNSAGVVVCQISRGEYFPSGDTANYHCRAPNQALNFRLIKAKAGRAAPSKNTGLGSGTGTAAKDHCAVNSSSPLPSFGSANVNVPEKGTAV